MGHKDIEDVNNIPDFWSWFSIGLVPLLFVEVWDVSEVRANVLARCADAAGVHNGFSTGWGINTTFSDVWDRDVSPAGGPMFDMVGCPEGDPSPLPEDYFGTGLDGRGMHVYTNRIMGGVRMRQEYQDDIPCPHAAV